MFLDRIKGQAKREAWYAAPDEQQGWLRNPFGKYKAPTNTRSNTLSAAENGDTVPGISKTMSETDGGGRTAVAQRRNDMRGISPPAHADTLPVANTMLSTPTQNYGDVPRSGSPDVEGPQRIPEEPELTGKESGESSDTVPTDEKPHHHGWKDNMEDKLHHRKDTTISSADEAQHHGLKEKLHLRRDTKASHSSVPPDRQPEADDDNGKTKEKKKFTPMSQVRATILNSWINVLLIACKHATRLL